MEFHWYPEVYLAAVEAYMNSDAVTEYGKDPRKKNVFVRPQVYLAQIYWAGHGDPCLPTLDLHIFAQHRDHIEGGGVGSILTTIMCRYDYRHVTGLHPYRRSIDLSPDDDLCREMAKDIARRYGYRGKVFEFGSPEYKGYGGYGS